MPAIGTKLKATVLGAVVAAEAVLAAAAVVVVVVERVRVSVFDEDDALVDVTLFLFGGILLSCI